MSQGMNSACIYTAWISGRDGGIRALNLAIPSKRIVRAKNSRPEKFSVIRFFFFFFLRNETFRFRKIRRFFLTLDNFLVSIVISYCRSEVIFSWFYQELNAVRSENSELSCGISYFASFRRNNSVFTQNDRRFKKY